jgi:hypothetical protein
MTILDLFNILINQDKSQENNAILNAVMKYSKEKSSKGNFTLEDRNLVSLKIFQDIVSQYSS